MAQCKECQTYFTGYVVGIGFCSAKCASDYNYKNTDKGESEKMVDGGGKRYNSNKLPIELVPTSAMYAMADVLQYGATKYEPNNWRRGMKWSIPYACAMRHLMKWFEGEDRDDESGREHLSHVIANIAMLVEYAKTCPELDDRFKGQSRDYNSFKSDGMLANGMTEEDIDNMAAEHDPDNYSNGRT